VTEITFPESHMLSRFAAVGCTSRKAQGWIARSLAAACLVASLDTLAVGLGGGVPLYDAQSGLLPTAQPDWDWTYGAFDTGSTATVVGGVLVLDSTASAGQAGFNHLSANLDSTVGFTLSFAFRLGSESHDPAGHRSGFSIIVLDQAAQGVELSFWTNEVWAKTPTGTFGHSATESINVNTTVDRTYRLTFLGGQYTLTTDNAAPLSGALRHYTYASGSPVDPFVNLIYDQTNYIFFGDNTSSAAANVALSAITLAPVPEPGEWALMLAGLGCVAAVARRRRRSPSPPSEGWPLRGRGR